MSSTIGRGPRGGVTGAGSPAMGRQARSSAITSPISTTRNSRRGQPSSPRPTTAPGSPKRPSGNIHSGGIASQLAAGERQGSSGHLPETDETQIPGSQHRARSPEGAGGMPQQIVGTIEQLSTLEADLWSILEGMKSNVTYVAFFCREYWGTSASRAQLSLEKFNWSDRLHLQVQQACVLESLSLAVASHLCSGTMQNVSVTVRSRLRNLLYYIHENCLVLLDLLRQRYESQTANWTEQDKAGANIENLNFDILVRVNRYRQLRRGEHVMALRQHNEMIANVVRQLCRGASAKQLVPRGHGRGNQSPGAGGGRARGSASAPQNVLTVVNDLLTSSTPLDRMKPRTVRQNMLQYMRFCPLLNDSSDPDSPWPASDPYERFGAERFATEGPIIWFEPLPPMMADLDKVPKLPPLPPNSGEVYTLVLDLDETLVHYFEQNGLGNYGIRPGMFEFLQRMNELRYEIVIFTAATQDYADWVIDQIDPEKLVHHRLYRQHALPWGPLFAKDLRCLGRDLDRTLIIDNVQENFMLQPNNGIFIATWYEDPQDQALYDLIPLLEELIQTRAKVPEILNKYRDQIPRWAGFERFWDSDQLESPLDIAPPQPEPPQPPPQPQRSVAQANSGPSYASSTQPGMNPPEPARVLGTSPHQMQTSPATMANSTTTGYPDPAQPQQQARAPQTSVAGGRAAQPVSRPATTYSGIAGPYQSAPPMPVRQAFSGIAGPYQAALSRPAGHQ